MTTEANGVVLLAAPGPTTNIVYHALVPELGSVSVVLEKPVSRITLIRRRVKRLGYATVAGQVLFALTAAPALSLKGRRRIDAVLAARRLDASPIDRAVIAVPSVNADETRQVLQRLRPRVVVVNGTRIISADTLECVDAPFVNMHAGITPQYRGVHGGYWALAGGRPDLVGTTVHLIDTGIDTGPILAQATFPVTKGDSFATYPYLHAAAGVPLMLSAVRSILDGQEPPRPAPLDAETPSALRSHPTLWGYVGMRLTKSVR